MMGQSHKPSETSTITMQPSLFSSVFTRARERGPGFEARCNQDQPGNTAAMDSGQGEAACAVVHSH